MKKLITIAFILFAGQSIAQIGLGLNAHYVYAPKKEAFGGKLFLGVRDVYRIGLGYEWGKFNSKPTDRILEYYSVRAGVDFSVFPSDFLDPYIGVDAEYMQPTRIIKDYRVSFFPKVGFRFFNVFFIEGIADNLNEPNKEGRFFKFTINSYRVLIGFERFFGSK